MADSARPKDERHPVEQADAEASTSNLSVKQQRMARRTQKLAKFKQQRARSERRRKLAIIGGSVAAAAVLAVLIIAVILSGLPKAAPSANLGVHTYKVAEATHVTGHVDYPQTPPVGGPHAAVPLNCAVYSEPVPNENAVHSLEHGAVWVTYDASRISGDQLTKLRNLIPATYAILSPYDGLPSPIVASAWGVQLQVKNADDPQIASFIAKYRESASAPEPGAPCTGGVDGPGKVS